MCTCRYSFNAVRSSSVILSSHFRNWTGHPMSIFDVSRPRCQLYTLLIRVCDCDMCRLIVTGEGQLADHLLHGIDFFGDYLVPPLRRNRLQQLQVPADSQRLGVERFHLLVKQPFGPRSAVESSRAERHEGPRRGQTRPREACLDRRSDCARGRANPSSVHTQRNRFVRRLGIEPRMDAALGGPSHRPAPQELLIINHFRRSQAGERDAGEG